MIALPASKSRLADLLANVEHYVAVIRRDGPELMRRDREVGGDGYARQSMGTIGSAGWGDPTGVAGERALDSEATRDPVHEHARDVVSTVEKAGRLIEQAANIASRYHVRCESPECPHCKPQKPPPGGAAGCVSCARVTTGEGKALYVAAVKAGRCRWCYEHGDTSGGSRLDPPVEEIKAREERRVYQPRRGAK